MASLTGVVLVISGMTSACAPKPIPPPPAPMTALVQIMSDPQQAQGLGALYGGEFRPRNIAVSVGATVTWNNTDNVHTDKGHDLISDDGLFNKHLQYGDSFSYTFAQNGTFNYHDDLYDNIAGTVIVK